MRLEEREEVIRLPILARCRPETHDVLLTGAFVQRFPAHTELTREGDKADFLYALLSGSIELTAEWRGRETTIDVIGPPHIFIAAAVILDRLYLQSARVLEPGRLLMIPSDSVRQAMRGDAGFATTMAEEMAIAYRRVAQELKSQKLRTGIERLANWLLVHDKRTGDRHRFELPFDKKTLAARLGVAPEVLSRAFATLGKYDVEVEGAVIVVNDWAALERLAHPDPLLDDDTV